MPNLPANFTVEVDFPSGAAENWFIFDDATRGRFDTGGAFAPAATWADVTAFVRGGSIERGATGMAEPYARAEAGRLSLVLSNADARFDPTNLAGPYVGGGVTQVLPMRRVRVRDGGTPLFMGFVEEWRLGYDLTGKDAVCTLTAADGIKVLANFDGPERSSQGGGETSGFRINRILLNAGWDTSLEAVLENGDIALQATTLASPAWTECQLVSDTEIGELYLDAAGRVVFRGRGSFVEKTTPLATFGDGAGEVPLASLEYSYADQDIKNQILWGRTGGTQQLAEDLSSQDRFLVRSLQRSDLLYTTDGDALNAAEYLLNLLAEPRLRIHSITCNPARDPATLYPLVLPLDFGSRVRAKFRAPGRPAATVRDAWVRGISHRFTPGNWVTTFTLQDATDWQFLIFDNTTAGKFDFGRFAPP